MLRPFAEKRPNTIALHRWGECHECAAEEQVRAQLHISERRACAALGQHRSTQRKLPSGRDDEQRPTADIIELARQYGRDGIARSPSSPELKLASTVLLKIDTQGFEENVLTGGERTLPQTKIIIVETSFGELYRGQPRFTEIYRWLEERGFEYRGSWGQLNNPKEGMPIQQDGIFIRI
jgi:hypothetical protein